MDQASDVTVGVRDAIMPDSKDWTCRLAPPCPQCGLAAASMPADEIATGDRPAFANWDQDRTAVEDRSAEQDPAGVSLALADAAADVSAAYVGVSGLQRDRAGDRSDGSQPTVLSLGRYAVHALGHHLWDVGTEVS